MKRKRKYSKMLTSIFMALFMVFGTIVGATRFDVYGVKAAESTSDRLYSTEYYTLSYQNNEIKLLLNSDLRVYQNFTKEDLKELKDSILSVAYRAVFDDLDFTTKSSNVQSVSKNRNRAMAVNVENSIDVSTIGTILRNQLVDFETIDNALDVNGGTYDTLIKYYADRYAKVYVASHEGETIVNVLDEIASQLTTTIQETVDNVYELNGAAGYAPDVSVKINELIGDVKTTLDNGESIMVSLTDVVDIVKVVDNKDSIIEIINDLEIAAEIKDVVKNSSSSEIVNFFVSVDMDIIIDIFQNIQVTNIDVKDIVATIGMDGIIDVVDSIGMDKIVDLAKSVNFTSEDLDEVIRDNAKNGSLLSFFKAINAVTVDHTLLYADGEFKMSGLERIIKNLPRPSEVANYTDDQMKVTWALDIDTVFGLTNFDLTVGFKGDCSLIRSTARVIADTIDVHVENGTYYVDVKAPEKLDNILLRICNTGAISDDIKLALFNTAFGTIDEMYNKITNKTLDEYIEILKEVDYKTILANLYNAENLNKLFNTNKFTDARLDKFVDEVCHLVSKVSTLTYDQMKDFVSRYVDLSSFDDTAIENLVNDALALLRKIDALSLDSALLREFIDPNSTYTNENIYQYIDKLSNYEKYFDRVMQYITKVYEAAPDRIKDNTILDYYQGNGKFHYSGDINLNIEKLLNTLSSTYGDKIYEALSVVFDRLPSHINVSITANIQDVYKVTYNIGNEAKVGMLPVGANLQFFANVQEINNHPIQKWVDANGVAYTTMPAKDIELYAVTEFEAYINDGITKVYDGQPYTLEVTTSPEDNYTYQWYKNDVAIPNATNATYDVVNVADSGQYYCAVYSSNSYNSTRTVEVNITKAQIDVSNVTWNYSDAYTFDGTEKTITLVNVPELVNVNYDGNVATDAGTYNAKAILDVANENYEIVGSVADLQWAINAKAVDVNWAKEDAYTYNDSVQNMPTASYTDVNGNVVDLIVTEKDGKEFKNAGNYVFVVTSADANYTLNNTTLEVTMDKAKIDVSDVTWDYTAPFVYDGNEKTVALSDTVAHATPVYTGNTATDAGTYTASVTFTPENANYEIVGSVADLQWTIETVKVDVSELTWNYTDPFVYDGNEKTVVLSDTVAHATPVYTGNAATNVGTYTASVTFTPENANYEIVGSVADLQWKINKAVVDAAIMRWDYTTPFVYNGEEKVVTLLNVPSFVGKELTGTLKATNAGTYTAKVTFAASDNYYIIGSVADLQWTIEKAKINIYELRWDYTDSFVYDGNAKTVELSETVAHVTPVYTGNTATDAGTYTASVTFTVDNDNYVLVGSVADLVWTIEKAEIDVSGLTWNYTDPFTYDGTEKTVTLNSVPEFVNITYYNNAQTNAGSYQALAVAKSTSANYSISGVVAPLNWKINATTTKVNEMVYTDKNGVELVKVTAEKGVDASNKLNFTDETATTGNVDLSSLVKDGEEANILKTYDISFADANGDVVTYEDKFAVRLLIPEALRDKENLKVIHIADDGTITDMNATRDGNYMTFNTTHFSKYAIVEVTTPEKPAKVTPWWVWVLIALAIVVIILLIVLILRRRKPNDEEETPAAVVETTNDSTEYLVVDAKGNVGQANLKEAKDEEVLLAILPRDYAVGKVEDGNISLFKECYPILDAVGSVHHNEDGSIDINIFKEKMRVVAEPGTVDEESIVVHRQADNVIVELNEHSEVVIQVTNRKALYTIVEDDKLIIVKVRKDLYN